MPLLWHPTTLVRVVCMPVLTKGPVHTPNPLLAARCLSAWTDQHCCATVDMAIPCWPGAVICTGSQDRTAKVWKLPNLVLSLTLKGHKRGIWAVAFSPVDQAVATASGGVCNGYSMLA